MFFVKAFSIFGAGVLASLSPCVYPILPITLGYFGSTTAKGRNTKVLLYILGQALALTLLAWITVKSGESLGFTSQDPWVNFLVGLFLLGFGIFSFLDRLPAFLETWNAKISHRQVQAGLLGALILGISSALLASPCTTPILSGVLSLMATEKSMVLGLFYMLAYTLGFSLLLMLLGFGLFKSLPRSGLWLKRVQQFSGLLLIIAGLYYLSLPFTEKLWTF